MIDFIAGCLSGISQTLVGHPFDTIKVLLQNNKTTKSLKLKNYFRGISYPLAFSMFINSLCFGTYNKTNEILNNTLLSGSIAGTIISPFVHLQCIGKVNNQVGKKVVLKDFLTTRGLLSTFYREFFAFSTYFTVYEQTKKIIDNCLISGGISGLANWTITYPIDVVRNRVYAQNISIKNAIKQGALWKGYSYCASRSVIVNGIGFWVYEKSKLFLLSSRRNSD